MSRILPKQVTDSFRRSHNVILGVMGIDVDLYIPTNSTSLEGLEAFKTLEDRTYQKVETVAFINWNPNMVQLKKLNLFTEDELPIICYLPNDLARQIETDSYLSVPIEEVPNNIKATEFEIVNKRIPNMQDIVVFSAFLLVPRRK